jgi:hypothetical protein
MEVREALAFLDTCRFWSLTSRSASCSVSTPRPQTGEAAAGWKPWVRYMVRRKAGESLDAMLVRCVAAAKAGKAASWPPGLQAAPGGSCGACGASGKAAAIRVDRALRLALCRDCRAGLEPAAERGQLRQR